MSDFIKSPMNYTGGKYKLLPQILPIFPKKIGTFLDVFTGGANVAINVPAEKVIANDISPQVIEIYKGIQKSGEEISLNKVLSVIEEYQLTKTNREGYLKLRENYNNGDKSWENLYALICHSFNNQIRFNKKQEYNMPFGKDRSSFNTSLKDKFKKFSRIISETNIQFTSNDFREITISELTGDDFVYLDPPYLITTASYNESGGWTTQDDSDLFDFCDNLTDAGVPFALSNVFNHNGSENAPLKEWAENYHVTYLTHNYSNCNYQKKSKDKTSEEVLITNYVPVFKEER